jgi:hypothetical protein
MRGVPCVWTLVLALALSACSFGAHDTDDDVSPADASPADATPDAMTCVAPFVASSSGCHAFPNATHLVPTTWPRARRACQDLGGDLAIINTAAESAQVASALAAASGRRVWIGLSGGGTDGSSWTWRDGETVAQKALSLWHVNQPVVNTGCAVVRPDNGKWAGRACNERMVVVCEKPSREVIDAARAFDSSSASTPWSRGVPPVPEDRCTSRRRPRPDSPGSPAARSRAGQARR